MLDLIRRRPIGTLEKWAFAAAVLVRLVLIVYGAWQDNNMTVKYTDIDYEVVNDGARFMSQGGSPYDRATYRYTPLLAALLIPNQLFGKIWGKLVFSACDILIGWLIIRILRSPPKPISQLPTASDATSLVAACIWLFNPFAINVSTRGNAESTIGALVLLTLHFLNRKQYVTAGAIYGLAIHFKIYPIICSLALFLWIDSERAIKGRLWKRMRRLLSPNRLTFTAATVISLATLTVLTYLLYGWKAIYETYLYHIVRKDPRHNFSVYFYYIYLTSVDYGTPECAFVLKRKHVQSSYDSLTYSLFSKVVGYIPFVLQLSVVALLTFKFYRSIAFCMFIQVFCFVAFNKVCTVQYFIWYFSLLPLLLPSTKISVISGGVLFFLWMATQLAWLGSAYLLEFKGQNTFFQLWLAGLLYFFVNMYIAVQFILHHVPRSKPAADVTKAKKLQ